MLKTVLATLTPKFQFAGFSFPKHVWTLPRGTVRKRLERRKPVVCGDYYHAPAPNGNMPISFYFESDFAPGLRFVGYCDDIARTIQHRGWYCDEYGDQTIRGIVYRFPHSRGFLAGWTMGESMASGLERDIYETELDAALAADSIAEDVAEREREYQEREWVKLEEIDA